jgi:hypothetical protein
MIMIENFSEKPWIWCRVSQNPTLSIEYVLSHLDKEWDWDMLMYSLHWHDIKGLRSIKVIPWNWTKLSFNSNLRLEDVVENMDVDWHWSAISSRVEVTERVILESGIPWHWPSLSLNPSVSLDLVARLDRCPWDWANISHNAFRPPVA